LALKEMVKLYLDLGQLEKAQDWLQAAEASRCEKDIFRKMYLDMLKACASNGNLMKAEKIFLQAQKAAFSFQDLTFYTLMVDAAGKGKDLRAAEKWFEKALDAGMEPDIVLFTSMVDAAFRSGDVRAAEYWQSRSSNAGCVANKVMLSTLVKGCAQAGYKEKALRWATQALEAGDDLVILNCIIDIHAKNGDPSSLNEATLALEKIRTSKLQADERSFGPIINAYAEKGNYEEALKYFRQMVDDHHIPASVIQYNQLLKACSRCRPPLAREAERLFGELMALDASEQRRKFKTRDLRPTRITLKALNRCVGARRLAQLCKVAFRETWETMAKTPALKVA